MVMSSITVKGIVPDLSILGNFQRFSFAEKDSSFQLKNLFAPTSTAPASTSLDFVDNVLSGFRFLYEKSTAAADVVFRMQAFDSTGLVSNIFKIIPELNFTFSFGVPVLTQSLSADTLQVTNDATVGGDLRVDGIIYGARAVGFVYLARSTNIQLTTKTSKTPVITTAGLMKGFTTGDVSNRLVATVSGTYMVNFNMSIITGSATYITAFLYKNGVAVPSAESYFLKPAGTQTSTFAITYPLELAAGDFIEIWNNSQIAESVPLIDFQLSIYSV